MDGFAAKQILKIYFTDLTNPNAAGEQFSQRRNRVEAHAGFFTGGYYVLHLCSAGGWNGDENFIDGMLGEDIGQIRNRAHHRHALDLKHSFGRIVIETGHGDAVGVWLAEFAQDRLSGNSGADDGDAFRSRILMDRIEKRAGGEAHAGKKSDCEQRLQEVDGAREGGEAKRPANGDEESG